jgi:uncharacterized protein YdcH (DUF465 family)
MTHTPHELSQEFPELADKMQELKQSDAHFARLFERYTELNQQVHLAETNVAPMEELAEVQMRKERAALKDDLYKILSA